jgi:hypothetical protein
MERRMLEDKKETDSRIKSLEESVEYYQVKARGYDKIRDVLDEGMSLSLSFS